mmetsp:Transcript_28565/g.13227  ORF Transcript_28565/g.13227 Transcript_28565/m.13227 type:complete len:93 (+) Transcript_28565:91-369(+)
MSLSIFRSLSDIGFAPKEIYCTAEFRIEEYIESDCVSSQQIEEMLPEIKETINNFHKIELPIDKTPVLNQCIERWRPYVIDKYRGAVFDNPE